MKLFTELPFFTTRGIYLGWKFVFHTSTLKTKLNLATSHEFLYQSNLFLRNHNAIISLHCRCRQIGKIQRQSRSSVVNGVSRGFVYRENIQEPQ